MNYSTNAKSKRKARQRTILISWAVFLAFGILIGFLLGFASKAVSEKDLPNEAASTAPTAEPSESVTVTPMVSETPAATTEPTEKVTSLGTFKLTAYCPCEKCCGKWGKDRPTDSEGNLLVKTASGEYAKEGVTIAADTSVLPFGTIVLIDGHEYIVQDRGGAMDGNKLDIYFESHEEALQFGVQYKEIFIIERMNEND